MQSLAQNNPDKRRTGTQHCPNPHPTKSRRLTGCPLGSQCGTWCWILTGYSLQGLSAFPPTIPESRGPIRFTAQAHRMAGSPGCLVSLPEMSVKHMVIQQINICKKLSHLPREVWTPVKLRELIEQALLLAWEKGTNKEYSDYQRKICQPSLRHSLNKSLNPELFLVVILETKTEKSISVMDTNYTHSHLYTFLPFPSTWGNNLQCGRFLKQRPDFISQEVNVKHTSGSVRCHQLRPNNLPSILMLNSPRRRLFFSHSVGR